MPVLVVGSIALDSVETPYGKIDDALGGSAVYFSYAASFFAHVRLVGVIGSDFPERFVDIIQSRDIDAAGLRKVDGKTFRWSGKYEGDMNTAETRSVELNVFGEFEPEIPEVFRDTDYVFLANGSPVLQRRVLGQMRNPELVVADTMNLWIAEQRRELLELLSLVDGVVLNDGEARQLTDQTNLVAAGRDIQSMGPRFVIVKKGEHGSMLISGDDIFLAPAYPARTVKDPTGAGDSFAGGMMGYLAKIDDASTPSLKKAIIYGTVVASFDIEDFSLNQFREIRAEDIESRVGEFERMLKF